MAISTLKKLLAVQYLRRGDGIIATLEPRREERLFGVSGTGRSTRGRSGVELEKLDGSGHEPENDTCVAAFLRLIAAASSEGQETCSDDRLVCADKV